MLILNLLLAPLGAAAVWSLRFMRSEFGAVEKLVSYLVVVTAIEQTHSAVIDNLKLLAVEPTFGAFSAFKICQLLLFPVIVMWLRFALFHPKAHAGVKALFFVCGFAVLPGAFGLLSRAGALTLSDWNAWYASGIWAVVLTIASAFGIGFGKLLRKGVRHDPVSS